MRGITSRRFPDGSIRQLVGSSWADEQPEALQTRADPTIELTESEAWELPAGWVSIVNDLHTQLLEAIGSYSIRQVGQKAGGLRFLITTPGGRDLILKAREVSLRTCELCGGSAQPSRLATRCEEHPAFGPDAFKPVFALPPGA